MVALLLIRGEHLPQLPSAIAQCTTAFLDAT